MAAAPPVPPPVPAARLRRLAALRPVLDRLYAEFNRAGRVADPVEFVRRYDCHADREVVAFVAAALAFGRVASINQSIERVLHALGAHPAAALEGFRRARHASRLDGFVHRWIRADDVVAMLEVLAHALRTTGSLEAWFVEGWDPAAPDVTAALESVGQRARDLLGDAGANGVGRAAGGYFFPRPSAGSACKRLNLFLRWMVRHDALDPGGWTRVRPAQLIVPLDTHVVRVGRCLRLTSRATPGWTMAREITASLRAVDPDDPVKYDFAICHLGMLDLCSHERPRRERACPLSEVCRPVRRRRPVSPGPSARR